MTRKQEVKVRKRGVGVVGEKKILRERKGNVLS